MAQRRLEDLWEEVQPRRAEPRSARWRSRLKPLLQCSCTARGRLEDLWEGLQPRRAEPRSDTGRSRL